MQVKLEQQREQRVSVDSYARRFVMPVTAPFILATTITMIMMTMMLIITMISGTATSDSAYSQHNISYENK